MGIQISTGVKRSRLTALLKKYLQRQLIVYSISASAPVSLVLRLILYEYKTLALRSVSIVAIFHVGNVGLNGVDVGANLFESKNLLCSLESNFKRVAIKLQATRAVGKST